MSAERRGIVAEQPIAAREEQRDHRGDEERERALIELREQQRADGRADDRRGDERAETAQ